MSVPSGLEIVVILAVLGILLLVGVRTGRTGKSLNILPYVVVGILLLVLFSMGRLILTLASTSILLILLLIFLLAMILMRSGKR